MNDFQSAYPDTVHLDPNKRVFYSHGLVLGVDEFVQEELYLLEKDRRHNRGLHGYGTVCGLAVDWRVREGEPELLVGPGFAVDPQGRELRVAEAQCARLNDWLIRHHEDVIDELGSPVSGSPAQLPLYLVLCYDECATDQVPVPSGPCQSLDRTMVPSRIADDFRLELRTALDVPGQVEEQAVRDLVALLNQIEILDTPGGMDHDDMAALIRGLQPAGSPAVVSPPGHMHPDDAAELLRTAFRVWVTEVRPALLPSGKNCALGPSDEGCILLARLDVPVDDEGLGLRVAGDVTIDEAQRPYLLHTRLLQEYLRTCCVRGRVEAAGDGGGAHSALSGSASGDDHPQYLNEARADARYSPLTHTHALDDLSDVSAAGAADRDVVLRQGVTWVTGKISHADVTDLAQDHHPQYLLADGSRPLTDHWSVGNRRITNLADAAASGDALNLGQAQSDFVRALGSPYAVLAAGRFDSDGKPVGVVYNNLSATPVPNQAGVFILSFKGYKSPTPVSGHNYLVKGTGEGADATFHVLRFLDGDEGIRVRVVGEVGPTPGTKPGFMVEISIFGKF